MGFITIFGGTFNPIHIGHCEILHELSLNKSVEKILLIPTKIPPHKSSDYLASQADRFNMCKIIASDYSNVEVSDIELYRQGKSYTIDTVNTLLELYPDKDIAITIGGDMLISFHTWKDYQSILQKCSVFTFKRADIPGDEYIAAINNLKALGANIIEIDRNITCVSSTQIRSELSSHNKSAYLDDRINNYIIENNLYGV